ncbi:MAG: YraN family protein [Bacteroidales bacterium]|nr:YraN family protein [Bacteroidales bacterium]
MAKHNILGKRGEELAREYLASKGYAICDVNWHSGKYELDIVAQDGMELVIVEVKTRSKTYYGNPEDFVTPQKIKRTIDAANHYLELQPHHLDIRFDIISVIMDDANRDKYEIEHIIDAFMPDLRTR